MNYVVAVSGGVDSIVLLDALANNYLAELAPNYKLQTTNYKLIIAHFDHGIRKDSSSDEQFVRGVAGEYGLPYETERAELGPDASEEAAREARYNFLRRCCKKYSAQLITAHHQDDVIETMLINLIRGTGWRGLTPMSQISDLRSRISDDQRPTPSSDKAGESRILRPLLNVPKAEVLKYAKKHNLRWREDSTNQDQNYLRNYIRHTLIPQMLQKDPQALKKLLHINQETGTLKKEIATELQKITIHYPLSTIHYSVPRYDLIMSPSSVANEIIYATLTRLDPNWHPSKKQIKRSLHFIKTGLPGRTLEVSRDLSLELSAREVQFKKS